MIFGWIRSALARLTRSSVMVQAGENAIVITGVVDGVGTVGGSLEIDESWTHSVHLVAWREGDGPIKTRNLRVEIPDQRQSQLDRWEPTFPARALVRFAIREPVREVNGRAFAQLRAPLPKRKDADLLAAADPILNPPALIDTEFGTFTPNKTFPKQFEQKREILGRTVRVTLDLNEANSGACEAGKRALSTMRGFLENAQRWDQRIREAIAEEYYPIWVENWRDPDDTLLNRAAFKARFRFAEPSFRPDGSFEFYYEDDDLFWGHSMFVEYDPEEDKLHAMMVG